MEEIKFIESKPEWDISKKLPSISITLLDKNEKQFEKIILLEDKCFKFIHLHKDLLHRNTHKSLIYVYGRIVTYLLSLVRKLILIGFRPLLKKLSLGFPSL